MVLIAPLVTHDGGLATGDQTPAVKSDAGRSDHFTVISLVARFALYTRHVRTKHRIDQRNAGGPSNATLGVVVASLRGTRFLRVLSRSVFGWPGSLKTPQS